MAGPVKSNHRSVTLLGFSMGMAMATTLLRQRPADFAAVVGLSGFVVDADADPAFRDAELDGSVPFFWGRDQQDPVITPDKIDYTMGWVRKHTSTSPRCSTPACGTASTSRKSATWGSSWSTRSSSPPEATRGHLRPILRRVMGRK